VDTACQNYSEADNFLSFLGLVSQLMDQVNNRSDNTARCRIRQRLLGLSNDLRGGEAC